jgi:hypothetical protein
MNLRHGVDWIKLQSERKMLNNKISINCTKKYGDLISVLPLGFLIFILCFSTSVFSQNNIRQMAYDINDPRNPDCPCHKRQKLAEEEYAQLNNAGEKKENNFINTNNENLLVKKKANSIKRKHFTKNVRKRIVYFNKLKFRISRRIKFHKKISPDYSICFKW